MSATTTAPTTWHGLSVANLWQGFGATVVGLGIASAALVPLIQNGAPTTAAGWIAEVLAMATALQRAFSK